MIYVLMAVSAGCVLWLYFRMTSQIGFPILMYHKVLPDYMDDLTVSVVQLEQHLQFLQSNGYQVLPLEHLTASISAKAAFPQKAVFITFDDGYQNNLRYAYPILEKYNVPATIFLPTKYIGQTSSWDNEADDLMTINQLKSLNPDLISFGLHSHAHKNYKTMSIDEITADLQKNIHYFLENDLPFVPAFAYPYGGRPKSRMILRLMKKKMQALDIMMAFRIGNRLNRSFNDVYELQRLDITGNDSPEIFQKKLQGKMKVF